MSDRIKKENIIPVGKQSFAYQCENISPRFVLEAWPPFRGGSEPYPNEEKGEILNYEFQIYRHTGNSIIVDLRKNYKNGKVELFTRTMSFAEFVNQVFRNLECNIIIEKEPYAKANR